MIRRFLGMIVELIRGVQRGIEFAFDPDGARQRALEEYRSTAHVSDMAHSGDPSTLVMIEDGTSISIIEYYKRFDPGQYETWRRLCGNSGLDPDEVEREGRIDWRQMKEYRTE